MDIPDVMRAAVLFGPNDLRVVDNRCRVLRQRGAGPGRDVRGLRNRCGDPGRPLSRPTALRFVHAGPRVDRHRGGSRRGVDEIAIGQRVAIHVHHGCGRCRNCLNGAYTACENYGEAEKGHRATGFTCDGGFAEYVVHNVSCVYPLPDNLSWEESVLISTAGTSVYGLDRAGGLVAGDTVVVSAPDPSAS